MDSFTKPQADHCGHRRIQGVVVVEGKTDATKVARLFPGTQTIAVGGSAISAQTIALLQAVQHYQPVILFFDPDYQGQKIRNQIAKKLQRFHHAYLPADCFKTTQKKRGVAEAPDAAVKDALTTFVVACKQDQQTLPWAVYVEAQLDTKAKRLALCKNLHINYANHHQLFRLLNLMGINEERFKELLNNA